MLARTSLKRGVLVLVRRYATSQQIRGRPLASQHGLAKAIACDRHSNGIVGNDRGAFVPSQYCRYFSSMPDIDVSPEKCTPIRILYGSQGGTAQIFSMQLESEVEDREVFTMGLHESSSPQEIFDPTSIHVILTSVAGVGEPPDNARAFYEWLMSDQAEKCNMDWNSIQYTVFGLGNKKAHPNHFNVIGKSIDNRLQELGAVRVHAMGLGDDGECIEDDFDVWLASFLKTLSGEKTDPSNVDITDERSVFQHDTEEIHSSTEQRVISKKYPALLLEPSGSDVVREDLFHLQTTSNPFYQSNFSKLTVTGNRLLNVRSAEYGLRELTIAAPDSTYIAGDHFCAYAKNSYCLVEAYLEMLNVDPHVVIQQADSTSKAYPHPTGITLFETLLHCIDLGAVPSPSFSRQLMGRKEINYKEEVAMSRRTVLDLALESSSSSAQLSLEDFLYNMPPMQPRYYSIASSPRVHPHEVYLTYRPVKYVSSRGSIREGTCTSYFSNLAQESQIIGALKSNPSFRLSEDTSVPVLLMAGGCGIAAIRSFLEERLALSTTASTFGEGHLFLGFRSPFDEVYRDMVEDALHKGVLSNVQVSYSSGCTEPNQQCRLVSETVRANGHVVWDLFENGGYTYLCGGARTFGAAIEREILAIIQKHGNMSEDDAVQYLRQLIKDGRFCEDLAD
jgi:NADPH-ferrihemoprotein reductase